MYGIKRRVSDNNNSRTGIKSYWVWCGKTDMAQNISIEIKAKITCPLEHEIWYTSPEKQYLDNGWQLIYVEYVHSVA